MEIDDAIRAASADIGIPVERLIVGHDLTSAFCNVVRRYAETPATDDYLLSSLKRLSVNGDLADAP